MESTHRSYFSNANKGRGFFNKTGRFCSKTATLPCFFKPHAPLSRGSAFGGLPELFQDPLDSQVLAGVEDSPLFGAQSIPGSRIKPSKTVKLVSDLNLSSAKPAD